MKIEYQFGYSTPTTLADAPRELTEACCHTDPPKPEPMAITPSGTAWVLDFAERDFQGSEKFLARVFGTLWELERLKAKFDTSGHVDAGEAATTPGYDC